MEIAVAALPEAFLPELDNTIERISRHPQGYQPHEFKTRRALLRGFPYAIVFRQGTGGIEINRRGPCSAEAWILA